MGVKPPPKTFPLGSDDEWEKHVEMLERELAGEVYRLHEAEWVVVWRERQPASFGSHGMNSRT